MSEVIVAGVNGGQCALEERNPAKRASYVSLLGVKNSKLQITLWAILPDSVGHGRA